jgi:hypothetical protein
MTEGIVEMLGASEIVLASVERLAEAVVRCAVDEGIQSELPGQLVIEGDMA